MTFRNSSELSLLRSVRAAIEQGLRKDYYFFDLSHFDPKDQYSRLVLEQWNTLIGNYFNGTKAEIFILAHPTTVIAAEHDFSSGVGGLCDAMTSKISHEAGIRLPLKKFELPAHSKALLKEVRDIVRMLREEHADEVLSRSQASLATMTDFLKIANRISGLDIDNYVRESTICEVCQTAKGIDKSVFGTEITCDIEMLEQDLGVKIRSESTLFANIQRLLDQRVMRFVSREINAFGTYWHVNVSIANIHSQTFDDFARQLDPSVRRMIVVELKFDHYLSSRTEFRRASRIIEDWNMKVLIDHVQAEDLPKIDVIPPGTRFVKVLPSENGLEIAKIREEISRLKLLDPELRVILHHCETEALIRQGIEAGIDLFEGWAVDDFLKGKPAGED